MKWRRLSVEKACRQPNLLFDDNRLEGLETRDRVRVVTALAHILMQAAGLRVEELDDAEG